MRLRGCVRARVSKTLCVRVVLLVMELHFARAGREVDAARAEVRAAEAARNAFQAAVAYICHEARGRVPQRLLAAL
jgi:hypothetical protein